MVCFSTLRIKAIVKGNSGGELMRGCFSTLRIKAIVKENME